MIGNMIKICSLDFLNRDLFEADIMTADGRILYHSGETITPEILLRLYFKEIYIKQPLFQKEEALSKVNGTVNVGTISTVTDSKSTDSNSLEKESDNAISGPRVIDLPEKEEEKSTKGPKLAETDFDSEEEGKNPQLVDVDASSNNGKGPKSADINFELEDDNNSNSKGPRIIGLDKFAEDDNKVSTTKRGSLAAENQGSQENPENEDLIFDEKQAQRIVKHVTNFAKTLNFTDNELQEIEQVAYYCNIGITEFKKSDLTKRNFRKMKFLASYEKLLNTGEIPEKLAEIIKLCDDAYKSDSFALESKIPYHHIVTLADIYEDLLSQNNSKSETLLKMLQKGGNQFNIFILHKFIKMMRSSND